MNIARIAMLPIIVCILAIPGAAEYDFDGTPQFDMTTIASGTINGEIYFGGGHGVDGNVGQPNIYTQNFTIPGGTVTFARLYVGVWGGKEEYNGTLQTTFNGNDFGTLTLGGENDNNPNVRCTGHGVHWVHYDVTALTISGINSAIANTDKIHIGFDGRMYGILLIAVIENTGKTQVQYWINDGHWNLNYQTPFDTISTCFNGAITDPDNKSTVLSTVYLTGDIEHNDTLAFNSYPVINNAADGIGSDEWGTPWTGAFDVDERELVDSDGCSVLAGLDNTVTFNRIDETYVHPVLAVLEVRSRHCGDVNVNGDINIFDVVQVRNHASNPSYQLDCLWAANVNGDDYINIFDVVQVRNHASNPLFSLSCKCQVP